MSDTITAEIVITLRGEPRIAARCVATVESGDEVGSLVRQIADELKRIAGERWPDDGTKIVKAGHLRLVTT